MLLNRKRRTWIFMWTRIYLINIKLFLLSEQIFSFRHKRATLYEEYAALLNAQVSNVLTYLLLQGDYVCLQCYQRMLSLMNFTFRKLINNRHRITHEEFAQEVERYLSCLIQIIDNVSNKSDRTIQQRRVEFTGSVLLESVELLEKAVSIINSDGKKSIISEQATQEIERMMQFILRNY